MIALLRYETAILARSYRWLFPVITYAFLVSVGFEGQTPLAEGLDWSAAMLVPAVALLTRMIVCAEPDAARAVVGAAAGPARAHLAALASAVGAGLLLGLAGAVFEVLTSESVERGPAGGPAAKLAATLAHPAVLVAGLAVAVICVLVGSAAGTLCNPPLIRHQGMAILSTLCLVVLGLAAGVSPAAAALRYRGGPGAALPHWPGAVPAITALGLAVVTWTVAALVAARRDSRATAGG
ncbi:MAG TPA: hypothetical protein VMU95_13535 [Trebonia sp.]|nr:hypothetical protein [Trebonia sp.]